MGAPTLIARNSSRTKPAETRNGAARFIPLPNETRSSPRRGDLRLVDEQSANRRQLRKLLRALSISLAVVGIFAIVVAHVVIDENQFKIDSMQSALSKAQSQQTSLEYQVSQLESPQRIIVAAEQQIGMVSPAQISYLTPVPAGAKVPIPAVVPATPLAVPTANQPSNQPGSASKPGASQGTSPTASPVTSPKTSPPESAGTQVSGR